jgi:hypothetical protein
MSLQKLARELDETARQTAAMLDGIADALKLLANAPQGKCDEARREAAQAIITAMQGQDRIEQRCHNMALAVRQFALLPPTTPDSVYEEIWASLQLDELRVPARAVLAKPLGHADDGAPIRLFRQRRRRFGAGVGRLNSSFKLRSAFR